MSANQSKASLRYRRDIDGLRGVAVLLVVAFHSFTGAVPGGFVGVDVFFVISGFLITGIILDAQHGGRFSFREFYSRRIRRIFPALILVLLATYAVGWHYLLPDEFASLGRNVIGGAAFVSNLVLWSEVGYFDFAANLKPLLHLWSLGIEEQFYIVWPLALWLVARTRRRSAVLELLAWSCLLGSWALCIVMSPIDPAAAFYLPVTRTWEILAGAVIAIRWTRSGSATSRTKVFRSSDCFCRRFGVRPELALELRGLLGFGLLVFAALSFNKHSVFPGWRATLPVLATVLLISAERSAVNRWLGLRPLVYVGLISYPLYLWHWPILAYLRDMDFANGGKIPPSELAGAVALSFALASATYHFVEKPLRSGVVRPRRVAALAVAMAAVASVGLTTVFGGGFSFRLPEFARGMVDGPLKIPAEWREHRCFLEPGDGFATFRGTECIDQGTGPLVFLWGDSATAALYSGFREIQQAAGIRLAEFAQSSCPPLLDAERPKCDDGNALVLAIAKREQPQLVLLHALWIYGSQPDSGLAQVEHTIASLRQAGIQQVVLIGPPPAWYGSLPHAVMEYYFRYHARLPEYSSFDLFDNSEIDKGLRQAAQRSNIRYISLHDIMCRDEGCLTRIDDKPQDIAAFDDVHMTPAAAKFVAEQLVSTLCGMPPAKRKPGEHTC